MIATAEDVGVFVRALNDGSLLDENEQAIYSSVYEYGHSGSLPGYLSIAFYHNDIDTVVVQFVNTAGGTPLIPIRGSRGDLHLTRLFLTSASGSTSSSKRSWIESKRG